jgi:hypothetical protein
MKTSNWIKLIGIVCIVFGSFGIISGLSELLMQRMIETHPELPEPPAELLRSNLLVYTGILIRTVLLIAGIFFLMKKTFALNLMYIALIISILYGILSLLRLNNNFPIGNQVFALIDPVFYAALLIGVYSIRKYYYKSPEELAESSEGKQKRKTLSPMNLKILSLVGMLCLTVSLSILGLWIYACKSVDRQSINGSYDYLIYNTNRVAKFNSYFPEFLQGGYNTVYLSIAFCILAIIFSSIGLKLPWKLWKGLNIIILICSILLLLLNLFMLM